MATEVRKLVGAYQRALRANMDSYVDSRLLSLEFCRFHRRAPLLGYEAQRWHFLSYGLNL